MIMVCIEEKKGEKGLVCEFCRFGAVKMFTVQREEHGCREEKEEERKKRKEKKKKKRKRRREGRREEGAAQEQATGRRRKKRGSSRVWYIETKIWCEYSIFKFKFVPTKVKKKIKLS